MKILVTGGTGFIGSHLCELLIKKNYKVICFDRYNPNYNLGHLHNSKYKNEIEFNFGDIRDYDSVSKSTKGCDAVLHLAALKGIPYSYVSPLAYLKTNLEGTYNVLESCKINKIQQVVITSTSETYGSAVTTPINEDHRLLAQSPYAASKISADQLAISYWKSFKTPIKIIRPFNTFGPRQSARAIIPTILSQVLGGKKSIKLGNLHTSRDLTYVSDTCEAFLEILKHKVFFGRATNVGSNNEITIKELIKIIKKITRKNFKVITTNNRKRPQNSEVERLVCDNSFFMENSNWSPKVKFEIGIKQSIDWFKKNKDNYKFNNYII